MRSAAATCSCATPRSTSRAPASFFASSGALPRARTNAAARKIINDVFGHDAGDAALVDTAKILETALGGSDVLARLGGDEFAAFSLDFTEQDLDPLRQRLRALADEQTTRLARRYRLSLSVGAAFADPGSPQSLSELLGRADAAMYEQKRARVAAGGVSIPPQK